MKATDYPYVRDAIADEQGNIKRVVIDFQDYLHLLEVLEDEGLYQAMMQVKDEVPLSLEEARSRIKEEVNISSKAIQ
ncbi:MAG: hypothetical protein SW833_24505 [Cyanobacteriota bacterium]|nr:hypothetical protein [Cyanobacteriota bacterium]